MCTTKLRETDADLCGPTDENAGSGMSLSFPYGSQIVNQLDIWSDIGIKTFIVPGVLQVCNKEL